MSTLSRALAVFSVASALAVPAGAETILITSGALDWPGTGASISVTMAGDGFSYTGITSRSFGFLGPADQCAFPECTYGTRLNLASRFSGGSLSGTATYNGVTYSPVGSLAAKASLDVRWDGGLTIPPDFTGGVLTAPFQFTGEFYYDGAIISPSTSVLNLLGSGLATVRFAPSFVFPGTFNVTAVRYEIESTAPVPEPTSMLLIGTGLAGLAALRRRARRAPGSD